MREGIIPVILGTAVTATGAMVGRKDLRRKNMTGRDTKLAIGAGLLGLGIAHIVLGTIDLIQQDD